MKSIVLIAAVAAVAACSKPAPEPAATTEAAAAPAPAAEVLAADGKSPVGSYKVTNAEGKTMTEVLNADGTYTSTDASGKVVETGKWARIPRPSTATRRTTRTPRRCATPKASTQGRVDLDQSRGQDRHGRPHRGLIALR